MSLTIAFTEVSGYQCASEYVKEDAFLASTSLLGHYDRNLFQRYGIFALSGTQEDFAENWKLYFDAPFQYRKGPDRMQIVRKALVLDVDSHCYSNTGLFSAALNRTAKIMLPASISWELFQTDDVSEHSANEQEVSDKKEHPDRELKNQGILEALPTGRQSVSGNVSVEGLINRSLQDIVESNADAALVNYYAIKQFGNTLTPKSATFFRNEQEYILAGKRSDQANRERVKTYLLAFRTALNLFYLELSPVRQEEAIAAAALLTGPGAAVTSQAILAGWAAEEGVRDVNRLLSGEHVLLLPTDETWMKQEDVGYAYETYLAILMFALPETTKLLRIQDLMMLNSIAYGNGSFDWSEAYAGFTVSMEWEQKNRILLPKNMRTHSMGETFTYEAFSQAGEFAG